MENSELTIKKGYKQTDVGIIPEDWNIKSIIQCADYVDYRGKTPPKTETGKFLVTAKNIRDGYIDYENSKEYIAETDYEKVMSRGKPKIGDVLITTEAPLGNVAAIDREDIALAQRVIKYRAKKEFLFSDYLKHYFLGSKFRKILDENSSGSTAQGIKGSVLHQLPVILPPLPEQQAIAEVLSDVDALITSLDQLITKKRNIKQGTMQLLLTGKKRLPNFSGDWETKTLGDCLLSNPDYGINAAAVPFNENLPTYLRITDISDDGKFISEHKTSVENSNSGNYVLQENQIVFARTGASTGKTYLYNSNDGYLVFAGFLIRAKVNPKILSVRFLKSFTETKEYWNWVRIMSMRSGQPGINGVEYAQLKIPYPKIEEQKAIAQILSEMDAEIEALETQRDKYKAVKQGMMQELLTGKTRLIDNG